MVLLSMMMPSRKAGIRMVEDGGWWVRLEIAERGGDMVGLVRW